MLPQPNTLTYSALTSMKKKKFLTLTPGHQGAYPDCQGYHCRPACGEHLHPWGNWISVQPV